MNAERVVRDLVSLPLMRENVFHSARYLDGTTEKEVSDLLLVHRSQAIVAAIKAQEKKRDETGTGRWLRKAVAKAISQLGGAYTTLRTRDSWCEHGVRGRVRFLSGEIQPRHGLALVESRFESVVDVDGPQLDQLRAVAPVTLMGVADFLYVASYLRTWRDLVRYLDSRSAVLREPDARTIGAEPALFAYYTAMGDSFSGCTGILDAKLVRAGGKHVRKGSAFRDKERALASILEGFIEAIGATGELDLPGDASDLRLEATCVVGKDVVRDDLCDLTIQERAALGEQIGTLSQRVLEDAAPKPVFYAAVRFGRYPEKVYMVVVTRDIDHAEASVEAMDIAIAGCMHYGRKTSVLLLANQLGPALRFTLARFDEVRPSIEMVDAAREYFDGVRPRSARRTR
jgi:hypothetical protein